MMSCGLSLLFTMRTWRRVVTAWRRARQQPTCIGCKDACGHTAACVLVATAYCTGLQLATRSPRVRPWAATLSTCAATLSKRAHLAEDLGRRLGLPLVLLDDVAEGDRPLVDLAHTVDRAHDNLVDMPPREQVSTLLEHELEAVPHLVHEEGGQQQSRADLLDAHRREVPHLLNELLQRHLVRGRVRVRGRGRVRFGVGVKVRVCGQWEGEVTG
eukprot:scaffold61852_cov34-Phaeocystis_antarctica.AAC.4